MIFIKKNYHEILVSLVFIFFFILGINTFEDYGISVDEKFQRLNGFFWLNYLLEFTDLVNFKYLVSQKILTIKDFSLSDINKFNFYGILFDLPAAYFEIFFNFKSTSDIYNFRHFLNFLYFFVGSIFFYKILINRFDRYSSLLGTLLFLFSPRIYGESFYNSKDIIFLSLSCIAIFYCFEFISKKKITDLVLFSFFSAACIQTRILGIYLPISFLMFYLFSIISNKGEIIFIYKYFSYLVLTIFFLYISWPYLWGNPIQNFIQIFSNLSSITPHFKIFFKGNYIDANYMPYSYLPTWIIISSPIINSFLFISGFCILFLRLINRLITFEKLRNNKFDLWRTLKEKKDLFIFINFNAIFFVFILFNITLVNSWRYAFFLNIFIVYIATFFIFYISRKFKRNKINFIFKITITSFIIFNFYKIFLYHPFQGLYFSSILSAKYKNNFEIDHSAISGKNALIWILNHSEKGEKINIGVASWSSLHRNLESIDEKNKKYLNIVGQNFNEAEYIYTNNISEVDKTKDKKYDIPLNFTEIYKLMIDDLVIYRIYKKK
mgnify:CR=1 FL=1|jgi:hypothetical protein|tara:strand:- start:6973 stop:8622 length:1650 start_codon:yes stop_codon:yes gene_type:complete